MLVACEKSGIVRRAFRKLGHDAWSVDLLPSDDNSPYHIVGDALGAAYGEDWDMMIAFPPCTHLAGSGARWFKDKQQEQKAALGFVQALMDVPIPLIAIENPVGVISTKIRKPDQIIQPYQFGHPEAKRTCLWLIGLPLLKPTKVLEKPERGYWDNQTPSGHNKIGQMSRRGEMRSRTYPGIAKAMAEQWGGKNGSEV